MIFLGNQNLLSMLNGKESPKKNQMKNTGNDIPLGIRRLILLQSIHKMVN